MRAPGRAALLGAALILDGCRRAPPPLPAPEAGGRARVVRFWERFNAGTTHRRSGDLAAAVGSYREALSLDPRHEDSLYYLGQCLREMGRPAEARHAFEQLLEVDPESARGQQALGSLLASPDPAEPLDLLRAERHFRRAHEINGEETGPMIRLAEVLLVTGRSREAREWLEAAARTNAKSLEAPFLIGYLAWEEGDEGASRAFAAKARAAARTEAPVRGVLGAGDRKHKGPVAAPPLARPLGRTLLGEGASFLRAAPDESSSGYSGFEAAWREVRAARGACARRAGATVISKP